MNTASICRKSRTGSVSGVLHRAEMPFVQLKNIIQAWMGARPAPESAIPAKKGLSVPLLT
ncbi:hypothetical protein [Sphingobacterium deserti]|uniref:hypothetical protein n=1 Tax=Sphingobacterium deserti TaxID=1229276 RepID=UPI0012FEACF2|nr:hypothetical protein [Sphingobacterium deserti]